MKLYQNVFFDEISEKFENHVGSEIMSLGQLLEKPYEYSRGHIFNQVIMKLGQNVFYDEILEEFENGSCLVRNYVTRSIVTKTLQTL